MKDGTFPIFPYYKCHKPFLIHPNSPVGHMAYWFVLEDMVNCLWGYSWESLIPSPTQRTGVKEANRTMFFSALWAQLPCPGTSPLLLKIPGLCHCSLHVPNITIWWSILSSLQCARTRGNASGYVGQRLLWKSLPTWVCDTVLAAEWRKIYPVLAAAIGLTQWH